MKIRIGVLSDTHLHGVNKAIRDIYDTYLSDKDLIVHAGDVVSNEIVDFLSKKNFQGVHGNMDPLDVKRQLPAKKVIELGDYRLGLIHGWGAASGIEARILTEFEAVDVIVYGHTHVPVNHVGAGVLFFNPGTATGLSSSGLHSIGILELDHTIQGKIVTLDG
ncbi:MAG: metallophosphoesterase family protein [Desulfatiglandaceae bacterium]|jgi:putative phosphoesterase